MGVCVCEREREREGGRENVCKFFWLLEPSGKFFKTSHVFVVVPYHKFSLASVLWAYVMSG